MPRPRKGSDRPALLRTLRILICAASYQDPRCEAWKGVLVCGLEPGHHQKYPPGHSLWRHQDIEWPVRWADGETI